MPPPAKTTKPRFTGPKKYAEYILARALITLFQHLPIGVMDRLGRLLGWLAWKSLKRRRQTVAKNVSVISEWLQSQTQTTPAASTFLAMPEHTRVREIFLRSGANLLAGLTFQAMSPKRKETALEVEGTEHLREALQQGKGVIMLLAHMGPWEALAQIPELTAKKGIEVQMASMYRPLNNRYLDAWFKTQRERNGTRMFSRETGLHAPVDFLRANGMLGILSDQKMREGVRVPFFGQSVPTNPIPGIFHRRTGSPILSTSIATIAPRKWRMTIRQVELPADSQQLDREALATITNQALEAVLSDSPADGFWFQKRFS